MTRKVMKSERRRHTRIDTALPIRLAVNGYDFSTSTKNLSCVGAYCLINKYIPPFTKVSVKMMLPIKNEYCDAKCTGVIVRTEDEPAGGFNIAIFFNGIRDITRQKISRYITQLLPNHSASF
ncbi:MAG: PilZ domain-containing protein [Candidatus Omnitrophota bacterium]|nr:PilZ domain-containing protein [Candidatus Omnitrophota bacterium]